MTDSQNPVARKDNLVIQEYQEDILVYDLNTHKAHSLNHTAGLIWKSCNGKNSVANITKLLENQLGENIGENFVWLGINQLGKKDLLAKNLKSNFNGQSRREIIKKIGFTSVIALPLVKSLIAPASVNAQNSCGCVNPGGCITQTNCPSTVNCNRSGVCAP